MLIENMCGSEDIFVICNKILDPKFFHTSVREAVLFLQNYYTEYNGLPSTKQIYAETGIELEPVLLEDDKEIAYSIDEIEKFCKHAAVERVMIECLPMMDKNDYGGILKKMTDAVLMSLNRDIGFSFFEDVEARLKRRQHETVLEPTGWNEFDEVLGGGLGRKQMLLFSANSGGGKSIVMANMGLNYVLKGYSVLYVSLELSEEMVDSRLIQIVSGMNSNQWKNDIPTASTRINTILNDGAGVMAVKRMSQGSNSNDIRSYLKDFILVYGTSPDVIIVDYLDLMGSNEKISADNIFQKDKAAGEELREIGEDHSAIIITASQQNRSAVNATDLNHSHIAGGLSKIDTTDVYASIIMNESMRVQGQMDIEFLKTRSSAGVGKTVKLSFNNETLKISDINSINMSLFNNKDEKIKKGDEIDLLSLSSHLD